MVSKFRSNPEDYRGPLSPFLYFGALVKSQHAQWPLGQSLSRKRIKGRVLFFFPHFWTARKNRQHIQAHTQTRYQLGNRALPLLLCGPTVLVLLFSSCLYRASCIRNSDAFVPLEDRTLVFWCIIQTQSIEEKTTCAQLKAKWILIN